MRSTRYIPLDWGRVFWPALRQRASHWSTAGARPVPKRYKYKRTASIPPTYPWHHTRPDPRGWARPRDRFSAAAALDTPFAALSSMLQKSALPHTARHTTSHYTLLPAVHDSPFTSALKRSLQTLITSLTPLRPLSLGRTNSRGLSRRLVVSLHRSLRQSSHVQMSCGRSCNPMHL